MSFDSFDLHPQIVAGVQALGYSTPTPIQRRAIPPILQGQDVLGLAQTGTGKTAVFVLPILQRLVKALRGRIQALVIAQPISLPGASMCPESRMSSTMTCQTQRMPTRTGSGAPAGPRRQVMHSLWSPVKTRLWSVASRMSLAPDWSIES